jgi:uncharacterized Fe-S cluster protein YjdI/CDGSH-type Zn-finger protein
MAKRSYSNDAISVFWDSERCIHTGICLRGLPGVFDLDSSPWITVDGAPADDVAAVVEKCPSGALAYERLDGANGESVPDVPVITARPNGPLTVRGRVVIKDVTGAEFTECNRATLCRCGSSQNQPFCDLSHKAAGFTDNPRVIGDERASAQSPGEVGQS